MKSLVERYSLVLLVAILAFAFFSRVYRLDQPHGYVFDEVYHAVTDKLIARNDPSAYEWWHEPPEPNTAIEWLHPPIAKYTQAFFILIFGENSLGWRLSSALFGVMVIGMTYILAQELFKQKALSLLAALLAALDGLLLVQSRIAMNDIQVTFFILLTFWIYQRSYRPAVNQLKYIFLTGIAAGLAMGTKWSGVFPLAVVFLFEAVRLVEQWLTSWKKLTPAHKTINVFRFISVRLLFLVLLPLIIYVLSYIHMFLQGKSLICTHDYEVTNECYLDVATNKDGTTTNRYLSHFEELHHQIFWYQTTLKATHAYQSRPWQWFLDVRPVWYHVEYYQQSVANIYAFGNPALFWFGDIAIITTVFVLGGWALVAIKNHTPFVALMKQPLFTVSLLLLSYFVVWVPWQFSPRIMFFYHYTPAVPLLCIILAYWLVQLAKQYLFVTALAVILIALCFAVWFPHWTDIPVSTQFAKTVYFAIPSWK